MGGIVGNRYWNSPELGAAFTNIANMYAPPGAQDLAMYAKAQETRDKNVRLSELWNNPSDPNFDRRGIVAGLYNPNQSYYAVDQANATTQRGQDIASGDSRYASDSKAKSDMFGTLYQPLNPGQVRPAVPAAEAGQFGLEGALAPAAGAPKPLTESEAKGALFNQGAQQFTPEQQLQYALGDQTPVQIVGPDGKAQYATPGSAIGQQAYNNPGAQAKPQTANYNAPNGQAGTAVFDAQRGAWVDTQTGEPIPAGATTFSATAQGTKSDLGLTTSNATDLNRLKQTITQSNLLVDDLESKINSKVGAAGLPGFIKRVTQDVGQVAKELSSNFADNEIVSMSDLTNIAHNLGGDGTYDPVYQEIRTGMLQLAYLNAQRDNPRGEVSRFALERQIDALGQGLFGNDQSTLAALGMTRAANERAWKGAQAMSQPNPYLGGPPQPPAPPAPPSANDMPTVTSPEEAMKLPSGTKFRDPQGNIRVVP